MKREKWKGKSKREKGKGKSKKGKGTPAGSAQWASSAGKTRGQGGKAGIGVCEVFCMVLWPLVLFWGRIRDISAQNSALVGLFLIFLQNPVETTIDRFSEGGIFSSRLGGLEGQ